MSDLQDALARFNHLKFMLSDDMPVAIRREFLDLVDKFVTAARKWADLEAQVADGARVVVERPHGHTPCYCRAERKVILGEGSDT